MAHGKMRADPGAGHGAGRHDETDEPDRLPRREEENEAACVAGKVEELGVRRCADQAQAA